MSLNDRGSLGILLNDLDIAGSSFLESLNILTLLTHIDPDNADWAEKLAYTRLNMGLVTQRKGGLNSAIAYYSSSIAIRQKISDIDPTNISKLSNLADIIDFLAYSYSLKEQPKNAEIEYNKVITIRRKILLINPLDAFEKGTLSIVLSQLAQTESDLGNTRSALSAVEEAARLEVDLIHDDPGNSNHKVAQIANLGMMGVLREAQGDEAGSTSAVEEMVKLSDEVAAADPTHGVKELEAFMAHLFLAAKYREHGKLAESLSVLASEQAVVKKHEDSNDTFWVNPLFQFFNQLYNSSFDNKTSFYAWMAATGALEVAKRWNQFDENNEQAKQQLATAYTIVAIAERKLNRFHEARNAFLACIEIRMALVASNKDNKGLKSDLSISWSRLKDLYWDEEDYLDALNAEESALEIRKELAKGDPGNLDAQIALAESYSGCGSALMRLERKSESQRAFEAAMKIYQSLAGTWPNRADFANDVKWTSDRLHELEMVDQKGTLKPPEASVK